MGVHSVCYLQEKLPINRDANMGEDGEDLYSDSVIFCDLVREYLWLLTGVKLSYEILDEKGGRYGVISLYQSHLLFL